MAAATQQLNVSEELAKLKHEKKNHDPHRLPANATVQRRPIIHPPAASPYAGSKVQKVVYVSSKTPHMSAVKRVRKLLQHIEKRATQDVKLIDNGERIGMRMLAEAREKLVKDGEEVLVKASGRAMEKALKVGEWFRTKETEMRCNVEVRTGSVSVVDDILDVEVPEEDEQVDAEERERSDIFTQGDTTMELLGDVTKNTNEQASSLEQAKGSSGPSASALSGEVKKKRRKRKKRPMYEADDVPEQRLRWVKTVEVAISFKA